MERRWVRESREEGDSSMEDAPHANEIRVRVERRGYNGKLTLARRRKSDVLREKEK